MLSAKVKRCAGTATTEFAACCRLVWLGSISLPAALAEVCHLQALCKTCQLHTGRLKRRPPRLTALASQIPLLKFVQSHSVHSFACRKWPWHSARHTEHLNTNFWVACSALCLCGQLYLTSAFYAVYTRQHCRVLCAVTATLCTRPLQRVYTATTAAWRGSLWPSCMQAGAAIFIASSWKPTAQPTRSRSHSQ